MLTYDLVGIIQGISIVKFLQINCFFFKFNYDNLIYLLGHVSLTLAIDNLNVHDLVKKFFESPPERHYKKTDVFTES